MELYLDDLSKKISLSEFEAYFKIPHQTIKNHLTQFTKFKILTEEKKERFLYYSLNLKNPLTNEYLSLCEKERLIKFLGQNTLFLRLYNELAAYSRSNKMLLFGSATKGKDYQDIDLLILSKNEDIKKTINQFEETYSVKIHLTLTEEKYLRESFVIEIKKKHVILNEHDYFIRLLYKNEL